MSAGSTYIACKFSVHSAKSQVRKLQDANSQMGILLPHIFWSKASKICKIFCFFCTSHDVFVVNSLQSTKNIISSSSPITGQDKSCQHKINVCPPFKRLNLFLHWYWKIPQNDVFVPFIKVKERKRSWGVWGTLTLTHYVRPPLRLCTMRSQFVWEKLSRYVRTP